MMQPTRVLHVHISKKNIPEVLPLYGSLVSGKIKDVSGPAKQMFFQLTLPLLRSHLHKTEVGHDEFWQ